MRAAPLRNRVNVHLYSGRAGIADGTAYYTKLLGGECIEFDILNGNDQDAADSARWDQLIHRVRTLIDDGRMAGGIEGPPCNTFFPGLAASAPDLPRYAGRRVLTVTVSKTCPRT